MSPRPDLAVVGGGIVGLGLALSAARRGASVVLLERGALGGVATPVSGAIVRTHYRHAADARLALEGLASFERFDEEIGGDAGFRRTGFAHVPSPEEVADGSLARRVAMLREVGVDTRLVDAGELAEVAPGLATDGVVAAAWEPRSGYADPARTTAALAAAAGRAGVDLRPATAVLGLAVRGGQVTGVRLVDGTLEAGAVALCCGAWALPLARDAGLELPIRPTAAIIARFAREPGPLVAAVDVPSGVYFRPDGDDGAIVGKRDWNDRPIAEPDGPLPAIDDAFADDARERTARRLPAARGWRPDGGRSGPLDMTPDGRPLLGPSAVPGLWLSVGWSGTGFKTGISAGRALAEWISAGEPPHADYRDLRPDRAQVRAAGVRTPH